jgi:hypothetical protein
MMRTYLHLFQSAEVFLSRVGYQNEAVSLGLGIRTGETAVAGISNGCDFGEMFILPYDRLNNLWQFSLGYNLTFAKLRRSS